MASTMYAKMDPLARPICKRSQVDCRTDLQKTGSAIVRAPLKCFESASFCATRQPGYAIDGLPDCEREMPGAFVHDMTT